jgi:hypothetical protein
VFEGKDGNVLCRSWDLVSLEKHTSKVTQSKATLWEPKARDLIILLGHLKNMQKFSWIFSFVVCLSSQWTQHLLCFDRIQPHVLYSLSFKQQEEKWPLKL